MGRPLIVSLVLLLLPGAGLRAARRAGASAELLTRGTGARAAALGGAFGALAASSEALAWNPAALSRLSRKDLSFTHASYMEGVSWDAAAYAQPAPGGHAWALGVSRVSWGTVDLAGEDGAGRGSLSPEDISASAGVSFPAGPGGLSAGVAGKYVCSVLEGTARTVALDAGVLSPPLWGGKVRGALAASNLGGRLRFDRESFPLPASARAALSIQPSRSWSLALDAERPARGAASFSAGLEHRFPFAAGSFLSERAGLRSGALGDAGGVCLGLGWERKDFSVDYAYTPAPGGWAMHLMSVAFRFRARADARRVRDLLSRAAALRAEGAFYDAALRYNDVLADDPDNAQARRGLRESAEEALRAEEAP